MHPRICHRLGSLIPIVLLVSLCSCATVPPRPTFRIAPDFNEKIATLTNIVILVDFSVSRASISKKDYYCIEESERAELLAAEAMQEELRDKQYPGGVILTPFIGTFLRDPTNTYDVAEKSGDPSQKLTAPFRIDPDVETNNDFKQGLLQTMACASYAFGTNNLPPADMDQISRELLPYVTKNTGADAILVVVGYGRIVTTGKQLTKGLATGLATAVFTLGLVSVVSMDVPYIETWAALVDLRDGKVLWSKAVLKKDFDPIANHYLGLWSQPQFEGLAAITNAPSPSPSPTPSDTH